MSGIKLTFSLVIAGEAENEAVLQTDASAAAASMKQQGSQKVRHQTSVSLLSMSSPSMSTAVTSPGHQVIEMHTCKQLCSGYQRLLVSCRCRPIGINKPALALNAAPAATLSNQAKDHVKTPAMAWRCPKQSAHVYDYRTWTLSMRRRWSSGGRRWRESGCSETGSRNASGWQWPFSSRLTPPVSFRRTSHRTRCTLAGSNCMLE